MPARSPLDAALVAAAQLVAGEAAVTAWPETRGPIAGLGKALIDLTPGPAVDVTVATAESADKALLFATLVAGWAGALAVTPARHRPGTVLALGTAAATAGAAGADGLAGGPAGAGVLAGAAAATALRRHPSPSTRGAVAAASAVGLAAVLARRRTERIRHDARRQVLPVPPVAALPDGTAWALEGLTPLLTPPERFYTTDVTFRAPRVEPRCWRLRVTGMVDRPLELSLADLLDLGPVELDATLVCVHNPVGGPRIGTGRWYGVPVRRLLDLAGVHPDAEQLVARAVDGFTAGVPVGRIAGPADALVALGMNGRPLEVGNGFPARLLTPGLWGADANTKWLAELELTTWGAVSDFWDRRGWPRQPSSVQPGARIDLPRNRATVPAGPVTVAGVAWAPPHGVTDVEVAVGDGPWRSCELSAELAPTAWRQWRWQWDAAPGEHRLRVRTVGRAQRQREHQAPPYPIGSSGLHEVVVAVGPALPGPARELRSRALAGADDARGRARLATDGVVAWRQRGFPRTRRWPTPA